MVMMMRRKRRIMSSSYIQFMCTVNSVVPIKKYKE
jgi:hypothetical protein